MNSDYQRKVKGNRLLVLLIVGLALFMLGSSIISLIAMIPLQKITNISGEKINEALTVFSNYFSNELRNDGLKWSDYAKSYFEADPILFDNIRSFYCAVQFLTYMPLLVIFVYFLRHDLVNDFKEFKKNFAQNIAIILGALAGMYILGLIVVNIYYSLGITDDSANESIINILLTSPGKWLMIISVVILAPIVEEMIFRKLFIDTCETKFKLKPIYAILISTVLFAFIHVTDLESIKFIFQYIALALPICVAYHYSNNNIYVVTIVHIINNLLSVLTVTYIFWL